MFDCPKSAIFSAKHIFLLPLSLKSLFPMYSFLWLSSVYHGYYSSHGPICCPIIISCPITGWSGKWFDSRTRVTSGTTCLRSGFLEVELWQWFRHVWLNEMFFWKDVLSVKDTRQESARSWVRLWSQWSLVMVWSTRSSWKINDMQNCPVQVKSITVPTSVSYCPPLRTGEYYLPSSSEPDDLSQWTTLL